jgi:GAF domain-containing protein
VTSSPADIVHRGLSADDLRDLLAIVNSSSDLEESLGYLAVQAQQVLGSDAISLYLRDATDPDLLRARVVHGIPRDLVNPVVPVGVPIAGLPVTTRRGLVVSDHLAPTPEPCADRWEDQVEDRGAFLELIRPGPGTRHEPVLQASNRRAAQQFRTIAALPLAGRDQVHGSMLLYYRRPHAYGAGDVNLSLAFANQAALAIDNARLRAQVEQRFGEIERRQRVAEGLRDLLAVVNSGHNLDEILAEVLGQSSRLLGNDAGIVYIRDQQRTDILCARASLGLNAESLAQEVRVGSPTTGLAVLQGRTLVCEDLAAAVTDTVRRASETLLEEMGNFARVVRLGAQTDPDLERGRATPRVRSLVAQLRAVVATPLVARGNIFGAIALYYAEPRSFSTEDVELARAFADQATQAIENTRLHTELEQRMHENERRRLVAEGMRDVLASVNSTRSLDEILDLVLAQASELLGCDASIVLLLDDTDEQPSLLTVRASRALEPELILSRLPVGSTITGMAVERGAPVAIPDVTQLESPDVSGRLGRLYRAVLTTPLTVRGGVQGAITLLYRQPREFSVDDISLAQTFADQTALAIETARLHAQTLRRSRDLEALYRADDVLYRSLQLEQVLQTLVDVGTDVLDADACSVLVWDERHERLIPGATRGFRPENVARMSHALGEGITGLVALTGQPISVEDALNDPRVVHHITDPESIRSLLHVPIKVNGEVFGVFGVNYRQARKLSGEEERVLLALAHRAAVAIENARLYNQSERRRHELEALYRADQTLHRSLRLDDVLRSLAEVAHEVLNADKTSVSIWDAQQRALVTVAAIGYNSASSALPLLGSLGLPLDQASAADVLVVTDVARDPRFTSPRVRELVRREGIRTAIGAPILVSGQTFGLFDVAFCKQHVPSPDQRRLVQAIAQRGGVAIHNARLFEQAQQAATAEERQRLARELHDAVTQTLFSASLIAEVLPRLVERDPEEGRRRLEELRRLTRGALAEMRTLLLELRPSALMETPFVQLLQQLAEASTSRGGLRIAVHAEGDADLPPEVRIGLYRIAQEALNNIDKHAAATVAELHFRGWEERVDLRISDDGRGFDMSKTPAGRLGLNIMRERARALGARLRIDSSPGAGTRIRVAWPRQPA